MDEQYCPHMNYCPHLGEISEKSNVRDYLFQGQVCLFGACEFKRTLDSIIKHNRGEAA